MEQKSPSFVQSLIVSYTHSSYHKFVIPFQGGGAAGTSVDLLFYPLDTVKTRLQSAQGFFNAGGFRGIYKGVGSVVIGSAPGGEISPPSDLSVFSFCILIFQPQFSSLRMTL